MRLQYRRCAGLDVHKKTISACVRIFTRSQEDLKIEERQFGTVTEELQSLVEWLKQHKVRHVAMESTGVYWKPVWNVLEQSRYEFKLMLVNPATVRALRGRKTDRIDSARIAEYLQFGLLQPSFVPPSPIRRLRDLVRKRVQTQQDRNRVINRIEKLLESANVKLSSVASNVVGVSGRRILKAIVEGRDDPEQLADLAVRQLRKKLPELRAALHGRFDPHMRWMLAQHVAELEWLDAQLIEIEKRIAVDTEPHQDLLRRLCTLPGVDVTTAWTLLAELGPDMSVFPSAAQAASWAGLCPGNQESAGKRFSGRTRKGSRYIRRSLVQSAWAAARCKNRALAEMFFRIARRRGMKKAAVAVAHRLLTLAYYIIRDGVEYREPIPQPMDLEKAERVARKLSRKLLQMGYEITLRRKPAATPAEATAAAEKPPRVFNKESITNPKKPGWPAKPEFLPTTACPKCTAWKIPCFHVKYQRMADFQKANRDTSTG